MVWDSSQYFSTRKVHHNEIQSVSIFLNSRIFALKLHFCKIWKFFNETETDVRFISKGSMLFYGGVWHLLKKINVYWFTSSSARFTQLSSYLIMLHKACFVFGNVPLYLHYDYFFFQLLMRVQEGLWPICPAAPWAISSAWYPGWQLSPTLGSRCCCSVFKHL